MSKGAASVDMSIWTLIQRYIDETGATEASILRRAELGKGTFTAWRARGVPQLPSRGDLLALAGALKVDYETVLTAVLHDTKFLPESAARAEQARIEELWQRSDEVRQARRKKLLDNLLADSEGSVNDALNLLHDLYLDGSVDPDDADEVRGVLKGLSVAPDTTGSSVAADEQETPIERGQGHDDFA